ncbi:glycosyltransferase family 39 protein [Mixia osmundae IAM 14324]|uniref:Dolichyl-phosphate-mannose--protein mannosyltransferase n=1 Tax=Mixia osmundae (strain CBS 9802 / IAM 14324 / JCM 22182 / KY 12970) TaxID=764103 RepID=G7E8V6_MIXOS|nr:glycosyltransferase family 39 protein [Mixia osmundae IAM 14324]KEI40209.1 glycosyltransferase family 39 protein [Mixia osmundae IAM 14324]GAA99574.1 hypothetical protein E5Q_06275 [Mixia osmundae IAM 14324]
MSGLSQRRGGRAPVSPNPRRSARQTASPTRSDQYRAAPVEQDASEQLDDPHKAQLVYANGSARIRRDDQSMLPEHEPVDKPAVDVLVVCLLTLLAALLRFYRIDHPSGVVFDEVHFGKFASYYIRGEFFFDVHPPLAKLMLAFAGWLVGYDGHFEFENIGDDYIANNVPYISLRALPALLGTLTVPVIYGIMRESGYPRIVGILSASLLLFDNAHIVQSRLILLDAPLILFMALSLYCYVRFHKLRYHEFSPEWWFWLFGTGVFLSLTISCKMVGLFTFFTVGTAVVIDLWKLLDVRRGYTMNHVGKHFAARALALIVAPFLLYLFWFWVHFAVLTKSGPGDEFMTPAFQETLMGSPLMLQSLEVRYYDSVIIQHKQTKAFLHSHVDKYPLRYDDGRISSQGQQVTGYPFNDTNNHWQILPTKQLPDTGRGRLVRNHDIIRLLHVNTDTVLLTHDVASPLMQTNTEFTTWPIQDETRYNDTTFELDIDGGHEGQQFKSKSHHFKLIHVPTRVAMWSHPDPLPTWAFKQQEVNGNKALTDKTNAWFVDEILLDPLSSDPRLQQSTEVPKPKKLSFFRKWLELQVAMLQHNAGLTDSHPYATGPINWPFLLSGISFWTSPPDDRQQIYLIGNVVGWWFSIMAMSVFVGILGADQIARRRGLYPLPEAVRDRMYNSTGFFLVAWATHYFPFYLMTRQLFLHHYLPAHLASTLAAGAIFNFIATETINFPVSITGPSSPQRPREHAQVSLAMRVCVLVIVALLAITFVYFAPFTYGTPGLDPEGINRRRILSSWTVHFAK